MTQVINAVLFFVFCIIMTSHLSVCARVSVFLLLSFRLADRRQELSVGGHRSYDLVLGFAIGQSVPDPRLLQHAVRMLHGKLHALISCSALGRPIHTNFKFCFGRVSFLKKRTKRRIHSKECALRRCSSCR
jgi:hypothetical protein